MQTDADKSGCLSGLTYILSGHAFTQEDTALPQYVAHQNAASCHGNNGLLVRPEIPCLAHLPCEPPLSILEHLSAGGCRQRQR